MNGTIMITSVKRGKGKESGKPYVSISYLLLNKEYLLDGDNAKGFVDLTSFSSNDVYDDFKEEDFLKVLGCTFKTVQDFKNPLNTTLKLETIKLQNGKIINLL
ncbi:MAG: hypothetical protein IJD92_05595 [Bacilli bacterium]|nr:hypothetical protein [Bacilli bacterium]